MSFAIGSDVTHIKLGMIGTPWVGYEDGLHGHRYLANGYADRQGFDSSADAGSASTTNAQELWLRARQGNIGGFLRYEHGKQTGKTSESR